MASVARRVLKWLLVASVVIVVLVWLSLPSIIRAAIMSEGSKALRTKVTVGIVDLSLWNGSIRIQDLAVHPPSGASEPPLIGWRLLQVTLGYRDLFDKTIRLREVVLDTPRVALDRLADGKLNLQQLVAPPAPAADAATKPAEPAEPPAAETPKAETAAAAPPWGFALDRFVLRGGGVRFRDLFLPQSQPLAIDIPAIEVADVSFQPGRYGQPSRAVLDVRTEGSHVRLVAVTKILERGIDVQADLDATGLPLRRAQLYIEGVGWSELSGFADASFKYRLRTEARNELAGSLTVRKLAVITPGLDRPALAWDRLLVKLDPVDLLKRKAEVELVELRGASVVASLQGGELLPVIAPKPGAKKPEAKPLEEKPPPEVVAAPPPTEAPPPGPPWKWSVKEVRLVDSRLILQRPGEPLIVGVRMTVNDLVPEPEKIARVALGLDVGTGSFETTGSLRISPPAFGGTIRYDKLELPTLISTSPSVPQKLVDSATLGGELAVEAGLDANGAASSAELLRVRGRLSVDKLRVAAADPKEFNAGFKRLEVTIDDASVPGMLAAPGTKPSSEPIRVKIGRIKVDDPFARVTRTTDGIVLPVLQATAPKPAPAAERTTPAPPASGAVKTAQQAKSPPAPEVRVAAIVVRGGRVTVVDRTVKPYFTGEIQPIELDAKDVQSAGPAADTFRLAATGFQGGKLEIRGGLKPGGDGSIEIDGKRLGLTSFNPYVIAASPYSLGSGSLSIDTKVALAKDRYDTRSQVTVHGLGLQGAEGDTLFNEQFGVPLSTALALLTDLHGDISLEVPVLVDHGATKVDIGTVIRSALKSAIVGAVVSPLKLLGMVAGAGESVGSIEPPPLAMLPGRAEPSPEGEEQITQLANLLATRPGIGLNLTGQVGPSDVRWLHEQKLRAALEKGPGIVGAITGLPARNARKRVLEALVERANASAGDLSEEDAKQLDEFLEKEPPPTAEDVAALAKARAERVVAALRDDHGIEERRLTVLAGGSDATTAQSGVKVTLGLPG